MMSNKKPVVTPKNLLKVPHIKQFNESSCGAAVLCMVYNYYNLSTQTEEKIWHRLKVGRKLNPTQEIIYINSLPGDIRSNGLHYIKGRAVWEEPDKALKLVEEFLRIKAPLIVSQRWREGQPFGHYKIVVGMDENFIWVNDPEFDQETIKVSKDRFIEDWKHYSDEVKGGWFVAVLDENNFKKLRKLPVMEFTADIKNFIASDFQFLP